MLHVSQRGARSQTAYHVHLATDAIGAAATRSTRRATEAQQRAWLPQVICHGIPDSYKLKDGDIVNIDITCYFEGYHGDCSETYAAPRARSQRRAWRSAELGAAQSLAQRRAWRSAEPARFPRSCLLNPK